MKFILILTVYTLANIGLGYLFLNFLSKFFNNKTCPFEDGGFSVSIQFALGSALLSSVWLCISLSGLLNSTVIWSTILILSIPPIFNLFLYIKSHPKLSFVQAILAEYAYSPMYIGLLILATGVMIWFGILAYIRPPFGDAAAFYMVYAKLIAYTGKLIAMPGNYHDFSSIGISGELHFAVLMLIGTPAIAKLFAWIAGVGVLLLLKNMTQVVGGRAMAQLIAITILITSTTFSDYLSDGKTDVFAFLIGLAAIYTVLISRDLKHSKAHILTIGFLLGFALTAKFSFIIALLPAVILLYILQETTHHKKLSGKQLYIQLFKHLLLIGAGILIASLPHLVKNHLLFGNSLAPFFGVKASWASQPGWFSKQDTLWIISTYPAALVFGLYPLMGGNISVLWLAAIPLVFFIPKSNISFRTPVGQLTVCGLFGLLCWVLVQPSVLVPRYFLSTFMMLLPLPSLAVEYVWQHEKSPRVMSIGFVLISTIVLLITPFIPPAGVWTTAPNNIIRHIINLHNSPIENDCSLEISSYCDGFNALNKEVLSGERVFVAGYYTYWLRSDLFQCINNAEDFNLFSQSTAQDIWAALYEHGFMHIAIQNPTHQQYRKLLKKSKVPSWLSVTSEFDHSNMTIFHLKAIGPQVKPRAYCGKNGIEWI